MFFRKFSFWLALLSLVVCLFNATGGDDKNLLLYFTSPHLMFLESYTSIGRHLDGMFILYVINIAGWLVIGLVIDLIFSAFKKR